ncbi:Cas1p-domain-containing protein [Annulohypoxylon maeteangense]|uniref:Cas1p-domain-containing protein n=1 Tax=Annulohypoxylon maeteangense TaxID=1927788 RepID=UPI002008E949|nr:Cas1p-domain-containing protein [Annulohypoxylon maeteangense]KAI0887478.1 Cas1p-domain-containing protein [Annulohypoxylon maeteangense]
MFERGWVRLAIAFCLMGVFLLQQHHQLEFGQYDPYRCRALLNDGKWSPLSSDGSKKWEPKHCRMVEYPRVALRACLDNQKVVFVGDSTTRQVFLAAAKRLEPGQMRVPIRNSTNLRQRHQDATFEAEGVKLEFIWDPWLNSSKLEKTLKNFHALPTPPNESSIRKKDDMSPALILLGAPGLWAARYGRDDYLDIFKNSIDHVTPYISDVFDENMPRVFNFDSDDTANHILLAPVLVPEYRHLSFRRRQTITAERIKQMNDYLSQLSQNQSSHIPWVYNKLSDDFNEDGLHVSDNVAGHKFDVAINAHCNTISSRSRSFKGTCCVPDHYNKLFMLVSEVSFFILIVSLIVEVALGVTMREHMTLNGARSIVFVILHCFYYDRTTLFGKLERHYQPVEFIVMCLLWLLAGIFTTSRKPPPAELPERSVARLRQERNSDPPDYQGPGYLSIDHSLEIKGLMQGFILLYHYHHASQALWVYKIIRLFISGYFYLTAYGHTMYLLKTNDFSFKRVSVVLFRLNLLSVILPYAMRTNYTLYYFAPVVSFWYLVLYGMLRFFRNYNHDMPWFISKVIATAMVTVVLISTTGVLETAARFSHLYCNINWDPKEMRFRLLLDRYIVFVGAVVAAFVHNASVRGSQPILPLGNARPFFLNRRHLLNVISAASLVAFFYVTQTTLHEKVIYNKIHPFISWIPILSFVVLRNSLPGVREVYLWLPTVLGQISLETYVLQFHVWLGGSATAKLTLGLWDDP